MRRGVVLATAPGLHDITSIEDCLSRFDEALSVDDLHVPPDAFGAVVYESQQLGIDLPSFAP